VESHISVNAGFGDSHSAAEKIEYMNGTAIIPAPINVNVYQLPAAQPVQ
jgi:hypothetical protein